MGALMSMTNEYEMTALRIGHDFINLIGDQTDEFQSIYDLSLWSTLVRDEQ